MGTVYRATDTKLNRDVAIKVLPDSFADDPDRFARFTREALVLASLNHPNIAQIYGVEDSHGVSALVMELVQGDTLKGPLPLATALNYASQIAAALEAAHEKGVIHRDLKPGNVMVRADGAVKVLDFGLAKQTLPASPGAVDEDSPTLAMPLGMTAAGLILGTVSYMSPEQARGKEVDRRADIWSFGVVLYEMVTGIRPFQGADLTETLASVVRDTPDLNRVPTELRHLLSRCLEKDPNRRLRHIGDVMDLVSRPASQSQAAGASKPSRRWPAVAALLALSTGLSLWAPWRRESDSGTAAPVTRLAVVPPAVPDVAGNNFGSAISPDGLTLAFVGVNDKKNAALYLRDLNSLEARMISGSDGAGRPFWSPDSKYVAWFANLTLWRRLVSGGTVEKVTSIAGAGRGGTWNRDGVILFADQNNRGINRVPAGGGAVVLVTQLDTAQEDAHYYPQFLPDGRHFLYYRRARSSDQAGMYVGTLDDPKKGAADPLVLPSEYRAIYGSGHLIKYTGEAVVAQPFDAASLALSGSPIVIAGAVARNSSNAYADISAAETGVLAYGTAQDNSERTLRWLDRFGKPLATVGANISEGNIILSPDGTRVLGRFTDRDRQGNWVLNLERGTRTRVTFEPPYNDAVWSPSGNEIAYLTAGSEGQVYTRAADGSGVPRKVTDGLLARGQLTEWTTDGRLLSYGAGEQAMDIYETPVAGGKPRILIGGPGFQGLARLSPDGRWIAYTSGESSRSEVYVAGNNGKGGKWQISANGGSTPRWRRDGREIIYSSSEGLVSVPVTLSANSVSLGKPTALFAPPGPWDLAPDFSRVLVAMAPENQDSSFIILQNWTGLLKQTRADDNKK